MVTQNTEHYVDGFILKQVRIIKRMLKKKWDVVGIIDGREGSGKTTKGFQLCKLVDPTFDIDRVVFSEKQFDETIINSKPGQAMCLDEGMNVFFSRTTMSSTNIAGVRILAECRKRNLFLLIILPSFFELDRYVSLHRSSFLLHVYAMPTRKEGVMERGYWRWYDRRTKKVLYLEGRKKMVYHVVKPNFYGRFVKKFVISSKLYEAKKDKALADKMKEPTKLEKHWKDKYLVSVRLLIKEKKMGIDEFRKWCKTMNLGVRTEDVVGIKK